MMARSYSTRPDAVCNNESTIGYLLSIGGLTYDDLPSDLTDLLYGAAGQIDGTRRMSPVFIYSMVMSLPIISTTSVGDWLNKKREMEGEANYSVRYVRKVTAAARCASKAIYHFSVTSGHVDMPAKYKAPASTAAVPYNDEERSQLRHISINGSHSEYIDYLNTLKLKYMGV